MFPSRRITHTKTGSPIPLEPRAKTYILSLLLAMGADPDDGLAKQMLPIYVKEASEYSIAVESAPKK